MIPEDADSTLNGVAYKIGVHSALFHNVNGEWRRILEDKVIRDRCLSGMFDENITNDPTVKRIIKKKRTIDKKGDVLLQKQMKRAATYKRMKLKKHEKIINELKKNGAVSKELAEKLGVGYSTLMEQLKELKDSGVIGYGYFYIWQEED